MKPIEKDIDMLSNGVPGVYRSRYFWKKIYYPATLVLTAIIMLLAVTRIDNKNHNNTMNSWDGQVIVITKNHVIYDKMFYTRQFPRLCSQLGVTKRMFEEKANVSVYTLNSDECEKILEEIHGEKVDTSSWSLGVWCMVYILDEDGNIVYNGIEDEEAFIQTLKDLIFY